MVKTPRSSTYLPWKSYAVSSKTPPNEIGGYFKVKKKKRFKIPTMLQPTYVQQEKQTGDLWRYILMTDASSLWSDFALIPFRYVI